MGGKRTNDKKQCKLCNRWLPKFRGYLCPPCYAEYSKIRLLLKEIHCETPPSTQGKIRYYRERELFPRPKKKR